jgi:biotin synthesis protein BioG
MKIFRQIHTGNKKLILFFAGWSASPALFTHLEVPSDFDLAICYDYRNFDFDLDLSPYDDLKVVAWSLGVWVAEKMIFEHPACYTDTIAINGTPTPIDDRLGIPVDIFDATLRNITPDGLTHFNRRMFGSRSVMEMFKEVETRGVDELEDELRHLADSIRRYRSNVGICWKKAILGTDDKIFPFGNMFCYWTNMSEIQTIEAPHYPFLVWKRWNEIIG